MALCSSSRRVQCGWSSVPLAGGNEDGASAGLACSESIIQVDVRPGMILAAQAQLWAACTCTTSLNTKSLRQLPMAAALVCQEIFSAVD